MHTRTASTSGAQLAAMPPVLWRLTACFGLVFLGTGALQQYIKPYLLEVDHLGAGTSTIVVAAIYLLAFVCLTFTTYSIAWLSEYGAIVVGTIAYTSFAIAALSTSQPALLIGSAAVWGWGSSILWTPATALVLDIAPSGMYGRFSGVLYTGVYVGQAAGVLLLGGLTSWLGPRSMVMGAILLTLGGTAIALTLPRARARRAKPRFLNPLTVLQARATRTAALILLLSSCGYGLLLGIFGQVVASVYGLAAVGWVTVSFYLARIPSGSMGGWMIDRVGRRPVLSTLFSVSAVCLALAAFSHVAALLAVCALALGVQAAVVPVALTSWVGDRATAEDRPYAYAAVSIWSNVGTGGAVLLGQSLIGLLGGWQATFGFFAIVFVVCALLTRRLL